MSDYQEYPVSWIILCYVMAWCNFLAFALCLFAFQALIRSSSVRQNAYNLYVIFLIFPDGLQNLMVGLYDIFLRPMPQGFHEINTLVWFFYFISNFYLNAVVAYEINILATASYRRKKTSPPKLERVWKQVALVYLFSMAFSLWVVVPYKWSFMDIYDGPNAGTKFGSPDGGIFSPSVARVICYGLIAIPITYVLYIRIRIAWRKLLPKRGRTRVLSLFFMRIIIVFLLFYLPNTILVSAMVALADDPVPYFWIARVITPLMNACQAYVTLYMIMWKDDIRKAVATSWNESFGKCCCRIATTIPRRPSAGPSGFKPSRPWAAADSSNVNILPSPKIPSSLSASYRTETTLPKKSEWDEEDLYDASIRPPDPDPTGSPEGESDDIPAEDHARACHDEEQPSNCRDCTDAWAQGQSSGVDTTS